MSRNIEIIDKQSREYPDKLRVIAEPPEKLYCRGNLELLNTLSVGVVGSRRYTLYGKMTSQLIGEKLAMAGITVVSGLAHGIDAFSHEGALKVSCNVIGVLGTGHNQFYPRANMKLYEEVCEVGLTISEYEPEMCGGKYTFPRRNRIISALSEALIIVEATMNSGSLITAEYASVQGKDIYAVPGNINSQFSAGTNLLIRDGARPLVVIDDVVKDLGLEPPGEQSMLHELGEDEQAIVMAVEMGNGITVNEISHITDMKIGRVSAILTLLEVKGIVVTYGGKVYLDKYNRE